MSNIRAIIAATAMMGAMAHNTTFAYGNKSSHPSGDNFYSGIKKIKRNKKKRKKRK